MKKVFKFLKNTIDFLRILVLFFIMMHILYWISQLIGHNWHWLNIFKPVLLYILGIAEIISQNFLIIKMHLSTEAVSIFVYILILVLLFHYPILHSLFFCYFQFPKRNLFLHL